MAATLRVINRLRRQQSSGGEKLSTEK